MERSATALPAATRLGPVTLRVSDAEAALPVWRDIAGLSVLARHEDRISLGAGGLTLIELTGGAGPAPTGPVVGLFHVAIHVTSRAALGGVLARLRASGRRHSGQDHTVSDSLYASDDDGNGIEFAFDTPGRGRIEVADGAIRAIRTDGRILSVIEPLDLDALAAETADLREGRDSLPADSFIGHIHFRTNARARAHDFYTRTLGFRPHGNAPAFKFCDVGTDERRHMVAFNSWGGENLPTAPPDAPGVARFVILIPDAAALRGAGDRLRAAGHPAEQGPDGLHLADPDGNPILLTEATT